LRDFDVGLLKIKELILKIYLGSVAAWLHIPRGLKLVPFYVDLCDRLIPGVQAPDSLRAGEIKWRAYNQIFMFGIYY
jgi:hypothetical protein